MVQIVTSNSAKRRGARPAATARAVAAVAALAVLGGCDAGLDRIDREVRALMLERTGDFSEQVVVPRVDEKIPPPPAPIADPWQTEPPTVNPAPGEITYTATTEAEKVIDRLEAYQEIPDDAIELDLSATLAWAVRQGREFRFAEEEYVLAALRLLIQEHQWGPRFFNEVTAGISGAADEGLYDTSLSLVNEFRVTQRLPYGGEVAVRALARATEDLHQRVAGENVQDAELILSADLPLLRGAGLVAREDLIQTRRALVYAARNFERFRREYLVAIASDFFDLVVQRQQIINAERQLESFEELQARMIALVEAGREPPFQAALAAQETLFARDRLNGLRESYQLSIDRFKVRLGFDADQAVVIIPSSLELPPPMVDMDEAVFAALTWRLDLQTARDRLADAERQVTNAGNDLLPDLDLSAFVAMGTDPRRDRAGLRFDPEELEFATAVTFGLPLDREIERITLRQTQIDLERERRDYEEFRDLVVVQTRSSIRSMARAQFSLQLQEENIRIAELRQASIDAAPDRADARERSEAVDRYLRALDDRDEAIRDLQVAILEYLLNTGQLRVDLDGSIQPLRGMVP